MEGGILYQLIPAENDKILNYLNWPASPEINTALQPHLTFLNTLLLKPKDIRNDECPSLAYIRAQKCVSNFKAEKIHLQSGLILFTGALSNTDIAMVNNWLYYNLTSGSVIPNQWFQHAVAAHAITLLILYKSYIISSSNIPYIQLSHHPQIFYGHLKDAWMSQCHSAPALSPPDIDREAISLLERLMLEVSSSGGPASNYQWGLDAGNHQGHWNPFEYTPAHWREEHVPSFENEEYLVSTLLITPLLFRIIFVLIERA